MAKSKLSGSVKVFKRLRENPVWKRDPACYGRAWVDLLLLAVDRASAPQTFFVRGIAVKLERGQVGWSQDKLAEQWDRSREWVTGFLKFLKDEGMIKVRSGNAGTVISIVNYDSYQTEEPPVEQTPEPEADPAANQTAEPPAEQTGEQTAEPEADPAHKGKRVMVKGNGKGESDPAEVPSDEDVGAFCAGFTDLQRGIFTIPECWWSGWLANQLGSGRPFPRDWKRVLTLAFKSDFANRHPKAVGSANGGAKKMAATSGGQPGGKGGKSLAQTQFELAKELEQVQERLETCYSNGIRPDQGDVKREKELEAEIAATADNLQT